MVVKGDENHLWQKVSRHGTDGMEHGFMQRNAKTDGGERSSWGENDGVDFAFRGKTPTTMEDVTKILFGDEVIKMVKDGHFAAAFGLLFKWGYYLTMEGCTSTWAEVATENYIRTQGFRVVLGNRCVGEKHMSSHGWHRIGRKMATNSFQTTLRRNTANEKPRHIVGIFDVTPICRRICRQYASNSPKSIGLPLLTV